MLNWQKPRHKSLAKTRQITNRKPNQKILKEKLTTVRIRNELQNLLRKDKTKKSKMQKNVLKKEKKKKKEKINKK